MVRVAHLDHFTRRAFLSRVVGFLGGALTGAVALGGSDALARAAAFLRERQSSDGAWRSAQYGGFRDGDALTPLLIWALIHAPGVEPTAVSRGLSWLVNLTAIQAGRAEPWVELRYPLFTAGYATQVFAKVGDARRAAFWADLVERLRVPPEPGWPDGFSGAWSDAPSPPHLPRGVSPVPDMLAPNISATVLGLQALVAAGRASRTSGGLPFVLQCQNYASGSDDPLDDGGYFFAPGDPVRNKAGIAGRDAFRRPRFRSYGSATCDGILALDACGLAPEHPRSDAAFAWLQRHAAGFHHSGTWPEDRADDRESLRFYHAQAFAAVLGKAAFSPALGPWSEKQARALTTDLRSTQMESGAWAGAQPHSFEDDPLVATGFAMLAMAQVVRGGQQAPKGGLKGASD